MNSKMKREEISFLKKQITYTNNYKKCNKKKTTKNTRDNCKYEKYLHMNIVGGDEKFSA